MIQRAPMVTIPTSGGGIPIGRGLFLNEAELVFTAMRASGPGGQHVNTTSSAVQLRFHIPSSGLPERVKHALLKSRDRRISGDGVIVIRAENERSRLRNREQALARLIALIEKVARPRKSRIPTKPTQASKQRRLDEKNHRGRIKAGRGRVPGNGD